MKMKITMKCPDCIGDAVQRAAENSVDKDGTDGLTDRDRTELINFRREAIEQALVQWVKYSEYITVEFDTVLLTAQVCDAS